MYCGCSHTAINLAEPNHSARAICPSCQMIMQPEMRERRLAYWLSVALDKLGINPMQGGAQPDAPAPLPASPTTSAAPATPQPAASEAPKIIGIPEAKKTGWIFSPTLAPGMLYFSQLDEEQRGEVRAANPAWNDEELARVAWMKPGHVITPAMVEPPASDTAYLAMAELHHQLSEESPGSEWIPAVGSDGYAWGELWTAACDQIIAERPHRTRDELRQVRWLNPKKGWMGNGRPIERRPATESERRHVTDAHSPYPDAMLRNAPPDDNLKAELKAMREENDALKAALLAANGRAPNGAPVEGPSRPFDATTPHD